MLQKIKDVLKWVVIPLALLGAGIFALLTRIGALKSQLAVAKSEVALRETLTKMQEAKDDADKKEADYISSRDEFLKHPEGK